jgi:monoamine oxidase
MPGEPPAVDVVVIGAGLSGLTVARELCARGAVVSLLEARPRVGGRLLSHTVGSGGGAIDLGATWRWPNEPRVAALVASLGLASFPHHEAGDALAEGAAGGAARLRESSPLGGPARFAGGAQLLATALAAQLPPAVLRTSVAAAAVEERDGGSGLAVVTSDGECIVARTAVVLALPPALAAATLAFTPPLPRALAAAAAGTATHMGGCAKTVVRYATPFWRAQGLSGSAFSQRGPLSEVHDHSGGAAGDAPAALLGFSSGGVPDRQALLAQLVRLFGPEAAAPLEVVTLDWAAERYTAVPPGAPPQRRAMGGPEFSAAGGAMGGRLLWAATETAAAHAGHMEGALAAAERTVRAVEALRAAAGGAAELSV